MPCLQSGAGRLAFASLIACLWGTMARFHEDQGGASRGLPDKQLINFARAYKQGMHTCLLPLQRTQHMGVQDAEDLGCWAPLQGSRSARTLVRVVLHGQGRCSNSVVSGCLVCTSQAIERAVHEGGNQTASVQPLHGPHSCHGIIALRSEH